MISIEGVSLRYRDQPVLRGLSMKIEKGGMVALIGPNGAGKSTLLALVSRIQALQSGKITVDGLDVARATGRELARLVALLRQDTAIASRLRVRELVSLGRFPHSHGRLTPEDKSIVESAIHQMTLTDLADRFMETLSGGQRQRALIAMTLAQATDYILMDEPLNNLDMFHARELMRTLREIARERTKTVVVVLHDVNQAAAYADRIILMRQGEIVADGPPDAVLTQDTLEAVFGYSMEIIEHCGKRLVLHHI